VQVFDARFSETGAMLRPAGPAIGLGAGDYVWEVYHGSVSLSTLTSGEFVTNSLLALAQPGLPPRSSALATALGAMAGRQ
jgi:hypothetical protein